MALLESSPTKSSTVKKFSTISVRLACSPTSSALRFFHGCKTGGKIWQSKKKTIAAKAPVITKLRTVTPIIFPALFRLFILATAPAMEANTMGTTTQNIMRINRSPKNLMPWAKSGATWPVMDPNTMAAIKISKKR